MTLLGELNSSGVISDNQLSAGLRQVFQDMKDQSKGGDDDNRIRQLISDAVHGGNLLSMYDLYIHASVRKKCWFCAFFISRVGELLRTRCLRHWAGGIAF